MHYTNRKFWLYYDQLPKDIQQIADSCYELLKTNPNDPLKLPIKGDRIFTENNDNIKLKYEKLLLKDN